MFFRLVKKMNPNDCFYSDNYAYIGTGKNISIERFQLSNSIQLLN